MISIGTVIYILRRARHESVQLPPDYRSVLKEYCTMVRKTSGNPRQFNCRDESVFSLIKNTCLILSVRCDILYV